MDPVEASWLSSRAQQLVLITGIDAANRPGHAALLAALTSRVADGALHPHGGLGGAGQQRPSLNIRLVNGELALPAKAARPAERGGVLRREWPLKYTEEVPALIALFMPLEWDHPSWPEKKCEAESKVESIRAAASRCGSKLALVLLQERSLPPSEDSLCTERAAELCQQCHLMPKQLFVIPINGDLKGYVARLEASFHDLAQGFYQQKLKLIRARSIPNNSPALLVRQQFKLAFISELKQDTHTALRHYKMAYEHCRDSHESWESMDLFEWRSVLGLLNYKVCELCFVHSTPLEAIEQMKRHTTLFGAHSGVYPSPQLASIEFELWKSKQYWHFAELFERAIVGGITAVATANPGMHLDAAAVHFSRANNEIAILKGQLPHGLPYPQPDPLAATPVFFGQRPWRVGYDGVAPAHLEHDAVVALQLRLCVNHEGVLSLLSGAMNQYKKYACHNMQRRMLASMADEYAQMGEWLKAAHLLQIVCREHMPLTLRHVLAVKAFRAAWMAASVKELVSASLHGLAAAAGAGNLDPAGLDSRALSASLQAVLSSHPPPPPDGLSRSDIEKGDGEWRKVLAQPVFFTLQALPPGRIGVPACISVSGCFLPLSLQTTPAPPATSPTGGITHPAPVVPFSVSVPYDSSVPLRLEISTNSRVPLAFSRLRVACDFGGRRRTAEEAAPWEWTESDVTVEPGMRRVFCFSLDLNAHNIPEGQNIVLSRVSLEMGVSRARLCGVLEWDGGGLPLALPGGFHAFSVGARESVLRVTSAAGDRARELVADCLLAEVVSIPILFTNSSSTPLSNLRLEFKRPEPTSPHAAIGMAVLFVDGRNQLQADLQAVVAQLLMPGQQVEYVLRMSTQMVGHIEQLPLEARFENVNGQRESCLVPVRVSSSEPFTVSSSILNVNGIPVTSLVDHNPHLLKLDITANADIVITKLEWLLADIIFPRDSSTENEPTLDDDLEAGEVMSYMTMVDVNATTALSSSSSESQKAAPVSEALEKPLGRVAIEWKRRGASFASARSVVPLLSAPLLPCPVSVRALVQPLAMSPGFSQLASYLAPNCSGSLPRIPGARCSMRSPISIRFQLQSHHHELLNLTVTVELDDTFMFAGAKKSTLALLPEASAELSVVVVALTAGRLSFPRLQIKTVPSGVFANGVLTAAATRALPTVLFVLPLSKEETKGSEG